MTYRTHPEPSHIQVAALQINSTSNSSLRPVLKGSLAALVNITDAGYTGYGYFSNGFSALFVRPNGTEEELLKGSAAFQELTELPDTSFLMFNLTYPSWIDYCDIFLQDPNIAQNVMDSSRLLTTDMALHKADQIIDMMLDYGPEHYPGFNFSEFCPHRRPNTHLNVRRSRQSQLGRPQQYISPPDLARKSSRDEFRDELGRRCTRS